MIETAEGFHQFFQGILASVTKGRMAKIMRQRQSLAQIFIQAKGAANGTGDLRYFKAVGQAGTEKITFMIDEDLRLVLQTAKSSRMDDPVAVALKASTCRTVWLVKQPSAAVFRPTGVDRLWLI